MRRFRTLGMLCGIACLTAAGCEEPDGRSDIIPWWTVESWPEPTDGEIETVEEIFGMEMVRGDNMAVGSITLFAADDTSMGWGVGLTCSPWAAYFEGNAENLAHEIGHALGLEHVGASSNLMSVDGSGTELTDKQIEQARTGSWQIQQCK